ncbi:Gfo/Idh/MocA family protein [Cohnella sp. 56]|uniref:Gfo/Idh/MocA family protein n=1 Tax=Cohnella sp. 56 TaxID=3113722 RepID=UPI0030E83952
MKIAVIGAGGMGRIHAEAHRSNLAVRLAGIVDADPAAAARLASDTGARPYPTLESLLEAEQPDVVDICLPTPLHKAYVLKAAAFGKHVICEKPLAGSIADAEEMIEACEKAGVRLFVGHVLRFFPEYAKARDVIVSEALGQIATVRTERVSAAPTGRDGWYADYAKSGGVLLDLLIHDFDWLRWTFGEIERVYARSVAAARPDHAFVSLRFASGVIGYASGSWAYPEGFATRLEVAGQGGILSLDSEEAATNRNLLRAAEAGRPSVQVPGSPLFKSPYEEELAHFVACLADGTEPVVTARDALEALRVSLAAIRSAATGEAVTLSSCEGRQGIA